ncbi:uncharacterized protein BX664DRAFT_360823 [Halteromyces radiatus]|uniref:uncharacterized protein n=1 Tax=Halteromyces radiatus TaxID=101107 RepID=UPI00221FCDA3|nr:uncharacterized protein BX664DRAFT_360823 [Halteromyces radiatus]KAI8085031.1 hypothetical protein BX664DRAFT_360823 [Halteromyces radiatus]
MERKQNFLRYYTDHYCQHEIVTSDISSHIVDEHLDHVFDACIKPTFPIETLVLSTRQSRTLGPEHDDLSFKQEWKQTEKGYNTVDVLYWIVDTTTTEDLEKILPKLIAPILRIVDDYDVTYKNHGVILLHGIVSKLDPMVITKFGLENVFIDALFKCLHYMTDTRDLALLTSAYSCLIDLIDKTKIVKTKERLLLFEKILTDGVVPGLRYAGDKSTFLLVLLPVIDRLAKELETLLVRYLKVVVLGTCNGLKSIKTEVNLVALEALKHVIEKTWLRIPLYGATILQALATLWMNNCKKQENSDSQEICHRTKIIYRLLYSICQGQLEIDAQALLELDKTTFGDLIE